MSAKLSVNLNAIALLRNRRDLPWPNIIKLGRIALQAGASGLTVHPRPDQRHIRFSDLPEIRLLLDKEFPSAEFNIEGYPSEEFLSLIEEIRPEQVTLVPDSPSQTTSDHGWNLIQQREFLTSIILRIRQGGARVSLFVDANPEQIVAVQTLGANRIELYTGPYGACHRDASKAHSELEKLGKTADIALAMGLEINAGHDLTVENLPALAKRIHGLAEVSIGHGLIAEALELGMEEAVKRFLTALR